MSLNLPTQPAVPRKPSVARRPSSAAAPTGEHVDYPPSGGGEGGETPTEPTPSPVPPPSVLSKPPKPSPVRRVEETTSGGSTGTPAPEVAPAPAPRPNPFGKKPAKPAPSPSDGTPVSTPTASPRPSIDTDTLALPNDDQPPPPPARSSSRPASTYRIPPPPPMPLQIQEDNLPDVPPATPDAPAADASPVEEPLPPPPADTMVIPAKPKMNKPNKPLPPGPASGSPTIAPTPAPAPAAALVMPGPASVRGRDARSASAAEPMRAADADEAPARPAKPARAETMTTIELTPADPVEPSRNLPSTPSPRPLPPPKGARDDDMLPEQRMRSDSLGSSNSRTNSLGSTTRASRSATVTAPTTPNNISPVNDSPIHAATSPTAAPLSMAEHHMEKYEMMRRPTSVGPPGAPKKKPPPLPVRHHPLIPISKKAPAAAMTRERAESTMDMDFTRTTFGSGDFSGAADTDEDVAAALRFVESIRLAASRQADMEFRLQKGVGEELIAEDDHEDGPELLFSEERDVYGRRKITAGTIEMMVWHLTHCEKQDPRLRGEFLLTYASFLDGPSLLERLCNSYLEVAYPAGSTPREVEEFIITVQLPVRSQVIAVLEQWAMDSPHDFEGNPAMMDHFTQFATVSLPAINAAKDGEILMRGMDYGLSALAAARAPPPKVQFQSLTSVAWATVDLKAFAAQLTLMEHNLFSNIRPQELLGQAWSKKTKRDRAPNVMKFIDFFNMVSRWVITEIVREDKLKKRIDMVQRFIDLAMELRLLHNFNGIMEVVGAMTTVDVKRLKKTWEKVTPDRRKIFDHLHQIMSRDKAHKALRDELARVSQPSLPYLGMFLTDLTFLDDGNKDYVNGPAGHTLVNFHKWRRIASIIGDVQKYQKVMYNNIHEITAVQMFIGKGLEVWGEKETYEASCTIEPRET